MRKYNALVALGNWCNDYVLMASWSEISKVMNLYNIEEKGVFLTNDKDTFFDMQSNLSLIPSCYSKWCSGGSINNALHAASVYRNRSNDNIRLIWMGEHGSNPLFLQNSKSRTLVSDPLSSLRKNGVEIIGCQTKELIDLSICTIDNESRETKQIIIYSPSVRKTDIPDVDVNNYLLLLHVSDFITNPRLVKRCLKKATGIAVALGDSVKNIDLNTTCTRGHESDYFQEVLSAGKIHFIAGKTSDLINSGFLSGSENANPKYENIEIIGTNGNKHVSVWNVDEQYSLKLSVDTNISSNGSTLGAGDAYFGTYISARIQGEDIKKAHVEAQKTCGEVLGVINAQISSPLNLNQLFPKKIERSSESQSEGVFYNRIRLSAGFTIVTGGQTGVDQLAIKVAERLGLPVYAIMPKGKRTNHTDAGISTLDDLGEAMILELESGSYRYRTWASVYFSDGTLIWDFCDSEGTVAAIEACEYFRRPYLLVNSINANERLEKILKWALHNCVNVLNFAGNRASLIPNGVDNIIADEMYAIMKKLAWVKNSKAVAHYSSIDAPRIANLSNNVRFDNTETLRIGLPKTLVHTNFFNSLFMQLYGIKFENFSKLKQSFPKYGLDFYFSRPRDLPEMLKFDVVDIAFMGADLIEEYGLDWKQVLFDTGLFTLFLGTVSKDEATLSNINFNNDTIVSQYPVTSRNIFGNRIKHILGSAEMWVSVDKAIAAFDSWRTGATAFANGLTAFQAHDSYSLVMIADEYHKLKNKDNERFNKFVYDVMKNFEI